MNKLKKCLAVLLCMAMTLGAMPGVGVASTEVEETLDKDVAIFVSVKAEYVDADGNKLGDAPDVTGVTGETANVGVVGTLFQNEKGKYIVDEQVEVVLAEGMDIIKVPATELTVFTVGNTASYGTPATIYARDAFYADNWNTERTDEDGSALLNRVGIAVFDAPKAAEKYMLKATQTKAHNDMYKLTTVFYALSLAEYTAMDITDDTNILDAIKDAPVAYTYVKPLPGSLDDNAKTVTYELDKTVVDAVNGDKLVIVGVSNCGLLELKDFALLADSGAVDPDKPDIPDDPKPLPDAKRTISASFNGGDGIIYDADKNTYSKDSFPLSIMLYNLLMSGDLDREDSSAHNVKADVTLPDGFSFEQNADVKTKSYSFDEIEIMELITETIYLKKPSAGTAQIKLHVTGDNVNAADFKYDIVIDRYAFDVDIYRANFLTSSSLGRTMEDTYFNLPESPSQRLRAAGRECDMDGAAGAWNVFMDSFEAFDSPSSIADYVFEEKDMYAAIIMSLFKSSVDYKVMSCINNDITKQTKDLVSQVTSQMKTWFQYQGFSNLDLKKLSKEEKDNLFKNCDEAFKKAHPDAADIDGITSFIGKAIGYASDLQSLCEQINTYYNIRMLSDSMKQIMTDMYISCPSDNPALKQALKDCIGVMNTSDDEFAQQMIANLIGLTGKNVAQACIDEFWGFVQKSFKAAHPAAFVIQAAYEAGKYIGQVITQAGFNSDDIQEKYCKIIALVNTENLLNTVYQNTKSNFKANKTKSNAQSYNSAVDIMFNMLDNDCNYAIAFADALDGSLTGQITNALGDNTTEDFKKSVSSIQASTDQFHETVLTFWIGELEEEGNERFRDYEYLLDESWERMKKRYNIACPVDVYIYDKNGVIVGSVVDNVPYCRPDANITIAVNGDKKTVYMYGEEEYSISYVGNDTGEMDISIAEYDNENNVARNVYFNNIELTDGLTYTSSDTGSNNGTDSYVLMDYDNIEIVPGYDTVNNDGSPTYTASVERGYFTDQVSTSLELHKGENAEITAYVPEGYKFISWETDTGENIFSDAENISTTICMPDHDITITAVIEEDKEKGIIRKDVTLSNPNSFDTSVVIFFAVYDDNGNFIKVSSSDAVMAPGDNTFECSVDAKELPSGIYTAKIFVWLDRDDITPIAPPEKFQFEI